MVVGGKRKRSGRPKGTSKYGEDTKPMRIPLTLVPSINKCLDYYKKNGSKMIYSSYDLFYPEA